ncbi:MAG: sodium ion-translocating decarboxylase subunit beta [Deltaproteobacteria bacterium]|jgi:sodium ion-translocating decarboxylase beta subunit|nr:sodium ion-translocating decarboxylase subunit beta [Deltaproteobacteria bacterium]
MLGFDQIINSLGLVNISWGQSAMLLVACILLYLGIAKRFEPLLLIPIAMGVILVNAPLAGIMNHPPLTGPFIPENINIWGVLYVVYFWGIKSGLFPLLIFMGVGAMTDFGPLIANPKTVLLGAAAQFGIFMTLLGAIFLGFNLNEAASIGIIGGADGPTAIFTTSKLAPHLLGPIAVAAYSYMALVPIIQPPIMRLFTTEEERKRKMKQLKPVSKRIKIIFPIMVTFITIFFIPSAVPLVGMLMFGNLLKECKVVDRLSKTAENELINIVTILLGICVGATMDAHTFLNLRTIKIIVLGLAAFSVGTASGLLFGKLMAAVSKEEINPLIGAAGVSAVPMAARVAQKVGREADKNNYLLMHAMGPNVAGVIGSAIAAGVLIAFVGG